MARTPIRMAALALIGAVGLATASTTLPRIDKVDGIDFLSLFELAPPAPRSDPYAANVPNQLTHPKTPLSARTLYRPFANVDAQGFRPTGNAEPLFKDATLEDDNDYNLLIVDGAGFEAGNANSVRAYLVPAGAGCGAAPPADKCSTDQAAEAIFNDAAVPGRVARADLDNCELVTHASYVGTTSKRAFYLPVALLHLFQHQAPQLCLALRDSTPPNTVRVINTQLIYMTVPGCSDDTLDFNNATLLNTAWKNLQNVATQNTRPLPMPTSCAEFAALPIGGPLGTNAASIELLDTFLKVGHKETPGADTVGASNVRFQTANNAVAARSGQLRFAERKMRTQCCGFRRPQTESSFPGQVLRRRLGVCINPNLESCCSGRQDARRGDARHGTLNIGGTGKPYDSYREKCCFGGEGYIDQQLTGQARQAPIQPVTSFLDDSCPCVNNRVNDFCQSNERCCSFTKYPEIVTELGVDRAGRCYDPLKEGCCDTGETFNPGSQQCCVVTGVQSLDNRCPCGSNTECTGANQVCCKKSFGDLPSTVEQCNAYSNFPSGTGPALACNGWCMDTRFESCCNGVMCKDEYESCCGDTCCNRFTSSCNLVRKWPSSMQASQRPFFGANNAMEVCTQIEHLSAYRAAIVYVLPALLLLATIVALALALYFAKRQNAMNPLSGYEKFIVFLSFLVVIFAWPLIFSPLWKYALVFALVGCFSICAALVGVRGVIIAALFVQVLAILYFFDFFAASDLLNFGYFKELDGAGQADLQTGFSGVFQSLRQLWSNNGNGIANGQRCTHWYSGFFTRDANMEFNWIHNQAKRTFGYCERGWVTFLAFVSAAEMAVLIFLFFATLVAHAKNVLVTKVIRSNPLHF